VRRVIPGELLVEPGERELCPGRERRTLTVTNAGDRPVQVGSHTHFFEVNRALRFDREQAYGFRLDIPAGTAVRFEPGETRQVVLVALGGRRWVFGMNRLVMGPLEANKEEALKRAREGGFL